MPSATFDTPIGPCAIAWDESAAGDVRIVGVRLPDLGRPVASPVNDLPPDEVAQAIEAVQALLRGEPADLSFAPIDLDGVPEFDRRVYEITRAISAGQTRSYGEVAKDMGDATLARAVGQALGRNPFPLIVPCHRVLAAEGRTGGFSAPGGSSTKLTLLAIERTRLF